MAFTKEGKELEKLFQRMERKKKVYEKVKRNQERKMDEYEAKKKLGLIKRKPIKVKFGKVNRLRG